MIGEGDEDRLEQRPLLRRRAALGDQPVGELTEGDAADQLPGEVVAEQQDVVGVGSTDPGAERRLPARMVRSPCGLAHVVGDASHWRISSLCSPSVGGG